MDAIIGWASILSRFAVAQKDSESTFASLSDSFCTFEHLHESVLALKETEESVYNPMEEQEIDVVVQHIDKTMMDHFDPCMALAVVTDPHCGFTSSDDEPHFLSATIAQPMNCIQLACNHTKL